MIPYFDRHNDTLLKLMGLGEIKRECLFLGGIDGGHTDMPTFWEALAAKDYGEPLIRKIVTDNRIDLLAWTIDAKAAA